MWNCNTNTTGSVFKILHKNSVGVLVNMNNILYIEPTIDGERSTIHYVNGTWIIVDELINTIETAVVCQS